MKAIRMTVTTTVEITAPLPPDEQHITTLTDHHRDVIRRRVKKDTNDNAKNTPGSKIKNIVVASIKLVDVK